MFTQSNAIHTFIPSLRFVNITIWKTFSCQIICQKSDRVFCFGPNYCKQYMFIQIKLLKTKSYNIHYKKRKPTVVISLTWSMFSQFSFQYKACCDAFRKKKIMSLPWLAIYFRDSFRPWKKKPQHKSYLIYCLILPMIEIFKFDWLRQILYAAILWFLDNLIFLKFPIYVTYWPHITFLNPFHVTLHGISYYDVIQH